MNTSISNYILSKLQQRRDENNFRSLSVKNGLIDFYSNDYLGFARDEDLKRNIQQEIQSNKKFLLGSTGSRLLSGNSEYAETLEKKVSFFHRSEAALIFNSGFNANYGLLSTLPYSGDTIIYDESVHASIHDGIRNSKASSVSFAHNSMEDLREKLKSADGLKYVVVESVYSVNGDFAPLVEITGLCHQFNAGIIVDEAHATGIYGGKGEGRVVELSLENQVLARVHTFGKALGIHGAVVLCSNELKEFLINYCRTFIFSTALPYYSLAAINCAYDFLIKADEKRAALFSLVKTFTKEYSTARNIATSPIQGVSVAGNKKAKDAASEIQKQGFDVRAILYPTVPKGKECIRICLHSYNSEEEVIKLARLINTIA